MKTEFELIRNLLNKTAKNKPHSSKVKTGIGDDCAVISTDSKTDLVITADLIVEEIDFRLDWTIAEFIGHKALAVSLSDVAAMGGQPLWALLSIGVPERIWKSDFVEKFYEGWFNLARKFNVELAGGDVSRTPDKIVIDSIVAGEAKKNRAILRSGAQAGDLIYITGKLGDAAAGLRLLERGFRYQAEKGWRKSIILKQLAPNPQVEIGASLSQTKLATAMLDLSDGLSSDLRHLCESSGVGAYIFAEKIPFDKNLREVLKENEDEISLALNGGEDFELLFTVNPRNKNKLEKQLGKKVELIGEITSDAGKIELISESKITRLKPKGFRHF
jgi:thiamine-monophosphate kinase